MPIHCWTKYPPLKIPTIISHKNINQKPWQSWALPLNHRLQNPFNKMKRPLCNYSKIKYIPAAAWLTKSLCQWILIKGNRGIQTASAILKLQYWPDRTSAFQSSTDVINEKSRVFTSLDSRWDGPIQMFAHRWQVFLDKAV